MINLQPTLIGKLLKIRPLAPTDLQSLSFAASDPKIWDQHPDPRRCQPAYFASKFFEPALACKGALVFENLMNNNKIIGSSRYYNYRQHYDDIMIGYTFITRDCWGGAHYNREIKHLMLTHIFQYINTVLFTVGQHNYRSQAAVIKIGGKLLKDQEILERKISCSKSVIFSIEKKDFKGLL